MEITNSENSQLLVAINGALAAKSKMPFKMLYAISKPLDAIQKHNKDYEFARLELCSRLAEKDEEGNPRTQPKLFNGKEITGEDGTVITEYVFGDNYAEFEKQFTDLSEQKVEIPEFRVNVDELTGNIEPGELPNSWLLMKYFVKE